MGKPTSRVALYGVVLLGICLMYVLAYYVRQTEKEVSEKEMRASLPAPEDLGPVYRYAKSFCTDVVEAERGPTTYTASGKTVIWLPAKLGSSPCAHETNVGLTGGGSGCIFYNESRTQGVSPGQQWMEHKFWVRAVILKENGEEVWDDYYTDWLRGNNDYVVFEWSFSFVVKDGLTVSVKAKVGDASIEYTLVDPSTVPASICVSVSDPAWRGGFALPEYDGLRFEDIMLQGEAVDASGIDEHVVAYLYHTGVNLRVIGSENDIGFTLATK